MTPTVAVTKRGEQRVVAGHPWVYRSDVAAVSDATAGDIVRLTGGSGRHRHLGWAMYSDRSEIAIRMLTRGDGPIDRAFWRGRLERAIAYRAMLGIESTDTSAYRLVHGEGDLLPSFIVDRYGAYLVLQTLSQATDRLQSEFVTDLVELVQPSGILARNDPRVRLLEGLDREVKLLHGAVPDRVTVREAGIEYEIDLWHGQKTGLFLDQRENRLATRSWARGRLLDCFSYHGGFALALARACDSVLALDISEEAVATIRTNATRNNLPNVEARSANVFDELRELDRAGERFDTIVLDPPAFAKNKAAVEKATSGY
jgi:23S rRNA (cytosine1962-C5)-methyltransferase